MRGEKGSKQGGAAAAAGSATPARKRQLPHPFPRSISGDRRPLTPAPAPPLNSAGAPPAQHPWHHPHLTPHAGSSVHVPNAQARVGGQEGGHPRCRVCASGPQVVALTSKRYAQATWGGDGAKGQTWGAGGGRSRGSGRVGGRRTDPRPTATPHPTAATAVAAAATAAAVVVSPASPAAPAHAGGGASHTSGGGRQGRRGRRPHGRRQGGEGGIVHRTESDIEICEGGCRRGGGERAHRCRGNRLVTQQGEGAQPWGKGQERKWFRGDRGKGKEPPRGAQW